MTSTTTRQRQLEQRLHTITARSHRIAAHQVNRDRDVPQDWADQAQFRVDDEVVDALDVHSRHELAQIRAALKRIAEGTYGECLACGDPIGDARLDAMPTATLCLGCAARAEKAR
ncbi:MAG: TraR/DksA family transcriptional regulator [Deltaproteobacteria bacterium]|nr:TraR/DksA family transcriptional regulator [Deltaproteobacteria bacterium]